MGWRYSDRWAAGFFDGEGCVSIFNRVRKGCREYRVVVQITQKDRRPLDEIKRRFGGSVSVTKDGTAGCHRWRADGINCENFLQAIRPHVLVKREKVMLGLALRSLIGRPGRKVLPFERDWRDEIVARFRAA